MKRTLEISQSSPETRETGETRNPIQTKFSEAVDKLRRSVSNIQAVLVLGPHGVMESVVDDRTLNLDKIVEEYATLLRIARSASEDSGAGSLVENILVSEKSVMIARSISPDRDLLLLCRSRDQIGRARYELKQAAWALRKSVI